MPRTAHRALGARLAARPVLEPVSGWYLGFGQSANIAARFRKKIWRLFRDPFQVSWLEGLQLTLIPGNETSRSVFVTGRYEPNEFCLLSRLLKPGMTFIDIGANMGLYTLFAAHRVGESGYVLAIEPSRREMQMLKNNVEQNALRNVNSYPMALSDQGAEVELLVASLQNSGHNTLGAFGYNTALDHKERVRTVRLDELVQSEKRDRVDVIKMDIEGAELAALRGAGDTIERYRPVVLVELSDRALRHQSSTSADVLALLTQHGYRFFGFAVDTGLPTPLEPRKHFDSENIIAVSGDSLPW
ncbi:MAG TPA: FkbM family methyltransferase [Terriglobales bacterium]|nr:FkbM family methyltransferase [Terriglobales bacterium]